MQYTTSTAEHCSECGTMIDRDIDGRWREADDSYHTCPRTESADETRTLAERYADELLANYGHAVETREGVATLIAIAWLEGALRGSAEVVATLQREVGIRVPTPESLRA